MNKIMTLKPRLSEKAYEQSKTNNVYIFAVPITANKFSIAEAVASQFEVAVTKVRIVVQKGKAVPARRRRARPGVGYRADMKKAYVTLKEGDHIAIFDAEEEKATDKKVAKKAKKETK
jgi:large subunit ribosomal protein L23